VNKPNKTWRHHARRPLTFNVASDPNYPRRLLFRSPKVPISRRTLSLHAGQRSQRYADALRSAGIEGLCAQQPAPDEVRTHADELRVAELFLRRVHGECKEAARLGLRETEGRKAQELSEAKPPVHGGHGQGQARRVQPGEARGSGSRGRHRAVAQGGDRDQSSPASARRRLTS